MAVPSKHNRDFKDSLISDSLLDDAIRWIGRNLVPDEVFESEVLDEWIFKQGWVLSDE